MTDRPVASRRIVFQGLGGLGAAIALAGCGGGESSSSGSSGGSGSSATAGESLVATSDVPVGGGVVLPDQNLVITQPTEGEFLGYSATCTHTGTQLNAVSDGVMICPNHGSTFDVATGEVVQGPASAPLPTVAVTVDGDTIVAA